MRRVFQHANILFSAAWRDGVGIGRSWDLEEVRLVASLYVLSEAVRNIQHKKPAASERLSSLARTVELSSVTAPLSQSYGLPEKDRPILEAAAGCGCTVLLTGDVTHFGHLLGTEVEGVRVMTVSMFLRRDAHKSSSSMNQCIMKIERKGLRPASARRSENATLTNTNEW
jgi:hypothetical protein